MKAPNTKINVKDIQKQGYPFFAGSLSLSGKINIIGENPVLKLDRSGINVVKVEIGGKTKTMLWSDYLPLSDFGVSGETEIKLTLINNLRNLLGPHHLSEGEAYGVGPSQFFKGKCIWNYGWVSDDECETMWNDDYCFVDLNI